MKHTSSGNIAEALNLLGEAAKLKKDEVRGRWSDRFTHLQSELADGKRRAIAAALHAKDVGVKKTHEIAHTVDRKVHQNPWPYIGSTAAVGLLLGFTLARKRK